jgi:hypothetical protein
LARGACLTQDARVATPGIQGMRTFLRRLPVAVAPFAFALVSVTAHAADAREDVFKAYQKLMASRFAVDITTAGDGGTLKSRGEYDTVDRIHFRNDRMEMIVVPEGTWMKTAGADWMQPPMDMSGMVKQFVPKSIGDLRSSTKNAVDEGATTWNGQSVHAYSYDVDTTVMGIHVTSSNRIFLDAAGRIVHAESDGQAMGKKSHTTQDIRYDDKIRVNPPK